jgi:hypothetical protein
MRKAAAIFLLLLFLFNLSGFYWVFCVKESANKQEMQVALQTPETRLADIVVPIKLTETENNLFQQTGEDEIRYHGKMYDVARSERTPDGFVHFYCINDTQEENLNADFAQQVLDNSASVPAKSTSGKPSKLTILSFLKDYLPTERCVIFYNLSRSACFNLFISGTYPDLFQEIISPPPQSC